MKLDYDPYDIKKASRVFRALNHKLRQTILSLLNTRGPLRVTEIYVALRIEQSVVSQHLKILRDAGIVRSERDGKFISYHVQYERIKQIQDITKQLIEPTQL